MTRVLAIPRGSDRGADHYLVLDQTGRDACLVVVDPDGSVFSRVMEPVERAAWRRALRRDIRWGAAYWLEA